MASPSKRGEVKHDGQYYKGGSDRPLRSVYLICHSVTKINQS